MQEPPQVQQPQSPSEQSFPLASITPQSPLRQLQAYHSLVLHNIEKGQLALAKQLFDHYYAVVRQRLLDKSLQDYKQVMDEQLQGQLPTFQPLQNLSPQEFAFLSSRLYPQTVQKALSIENMIVQEQQHILRPDQNCLRRAIRLMLFKSQQELMALKLHIYQRVQAYQEAQDLLRYLPDPLFAIKSSVFQIAEDNPDVLLYKAFVQKRAGNHQEAISILENAIKNTQIPSDQKQLHLTLARYLKEFGFGVCKVMDCYKQALKIAGQDKPEIHQEMQTILKYFSQQEGPLAHKSMLEYFDRQIQELEKINDKEFMTNQFISSRKADQLMQTLVQKALYLKDMGQNQQAQTTYLQAIDCQSHQTPFKRSLLMKQHAYFLLELQEEQLAIESFRKSQQLYYLPQDVGRCISHIKKRRLLSEREQAKLILRIIDHNKHLPFHLQDSSNNNRQKIQFLKQCLQKSLESWQFKHLKADWHRQLARCYLLEEGNFQVEIISSLDSAIESTCGEEFDKTSVYEEKKQVLKELVRQNPDLNHHLPLLDYYDQKVQNYEHQIKYNQTNQVSSSLRANLMNTMTEKADLLKNLGRIPQSISTYQFSIEKLDPDKFYTRYLSYEQLARFCVSLTRYDQAQTFFEKADFFFRKNFERNNKKILTQRISLKHLKGQQGQAQTYKLIQDYLNPPWSTYIHQLECQLKFYMRKQDLPNAIETLKQMIKDLEQKLADMKQYNFLAQKRHKFGIYSVESHYLYDLYMSLAKLLKKTDKCNVEMLRVLDKADRAIHCRDFRIQAEKQLQMGYLDELAATNPGLNYAQILTKKADCHLMMKDYPTALRYYDELLANFNLQSNSPFTKSKILIKQAHLHKHLGRMDAALQCLDRAVELHDSNRIEEFKFLWGIGRFQEADRLIEQSINRKTLLIEKGRLIQKHVQQKYANKQFESFQQKILKTQLIQQSIEAYQKALNYSKDYHSIRTILQQQAVSYNLKQEPAESVMSIHLELLRRLGCAAEYYSVDQILKLEGGRWHGTPFCFLDSTKAEYDTKLLSNMRFSKAKPKLKYSFRHSTYHPSIYLQWKRQLVESMVQKNQDFSIHSLRLQLESKNQDPNHSRIGPIFMQQLIQQTLARFWALKKFKEAFMTYRSLIFLSQRYSTLSQGDHQHYILRKCHEVMDNFQHGYYKEALEGVTELKKDRSDEVQALISISLYKASNLALVMQKVYILCVWHMGDYQTASRLLTELIFTTGNFVEYINPKRFRRNVAADYSEDIIAKLENPHTFVVLVKYNSLMYSKKKGDFKQCLRKSQEFELLQTGRISDVSFHINYAHFYYNMAEQLYQQDDVGFVEPFCLFMKKCASIWLEYPEQKQKISQLGEKHARAQRILKDLFQQHMRDIEFSIIKFRQLCYASRDHEITFETMKKYMTSIDQKFLVCIQIVNHQVISDIQRTETVQRYWTSICKVIYKDILKKDVDACYSDMHSAIQDMRKTLKERTVITRECLTEDIITPERAFYECEIQAIVDDKIQRSLMEILQARVHLQALIQRSEIQQEENRNIYQRLEEVEEELEKVRLIDVEKLARDIFNQSEAQRQSNPFFADMLDSLRQSIHSKVSYTELQTKLTEVYTHIKEQISTRPNQSKQKISKEFSRVSTIIEGFRNLPFSQVLSKDELMQQVHVEENSTDDSRRFFAIMQQVLTNAQNSQRNTDEIQAKLKNLQNRIENRVNVFNLNENLSELSEMINWRASLVSRQNLHRVIANTSMHSQFQMIRVRQELQQAIERNFTNLISRMQEQRVDEKALLSALQRSMKQIKLQVSVIERQCSVIQQLEQTVAHNKKEMLALVNKMSDIDKKLGNRDYSDYVGFRQRINEGYIGEYDQLTEVGYYNPEKRIEVKPQTSLVKHVLDGLPEIKNGRTDPQAEKSQRFQTAIKSRINSASSTRKMTAQDSNPQSLIDSSPTSALGFRGSKPSNPRIATTDRKFTARIKPSKSFIQDESQDEIIDLNRNPNQEFPLAGSIQLTQNSPIIQPSTRTRPHSGIRSRPTSSNVKKVLMKKEVTAGDEFDEFREDEEVKMTDPINRKNNQISNAEYHSFISQARKSSLLMRKPKSDQQRLQTERKFLGRMLSY